MLAQLEETYTILGLIGSGGGGEVYKAYHKRLQKEVVIKKIHSNIKDTVNQRAEADILKGLRHSYLPQVYDYLVINNEVYTVMDFIPGKSFEQLLRQGARFSQKQVLKWARQLTDAVAYLHSQKPPIIHGDIKPENVMLMPNDDICLIDFNISSAEQGQGAYAIGYTDGYSAPEQYRIVQQPTYSQVEGVTYGQIEDQTEYIGTQSPKAYSIIDTRSDVYSIGATLYYLLTGSRPNRATSNAILPLESYPIAISDGFQYIIEKAMDPDPNQRFTSAKEMHKALMEIAKIDQRYKRFILKTKLLIIGLLAAFVWSLVFAKMGWVEIINEQETNYSSYITCLKLASEMGDSESIETQYQNAIQINKDRLSPYYYKLYGLYKQGEYEKALEFSDGVPKDIRVTNTEMGGNYYYILGNAAFELEYYEAAIAYFKKAIQFVNTNPEYYRDYAIALARMGNTAQASEVLNQAINYGMVGDEISLIQGEIYLEDKNYVSAEEALKQCIQSTQDSYVKMRAYLKLSDLYEEAWGKGQTKLQDSDTDLLIIKNTDLLLEAKQTLPLDMRSAVCEKLAQGYTQCGAYYEENTYYEKAIDVYNDMISSGWVTYESYYNLAVLYQKIGNTQSAYDQLMTLKDLYGEDYVLYKRLALLEIDIQAAYPNEQRNYSQFVSYRNKAKELYEEQKQDNESDEEMNVLQSVYERLVDGGWING